MSIGVPTPSPQNDALGENARRECGMRSSVRRGRARLRPSVSGRGRASNMGLGLHSRRLELIFEDGLGLKRKGGLWRSLATGRETLMPARSSRRFPADHSAGASSSAHRQNSLGLSERKCA